LGFCGNGVIWTRRFRSFPGIPERHLSRFLGFPAALKES